jgi:hypothetical protein
MRTYEKILSNGNKLRVTVCTPDDERGGCTPAFSVTGELWEPRIRAIATGHYVYPKEPTSCGCLHDTILAEFPELAKVVSLHLSDAQGAPMHAESNGFYWLAGAVGGLGEQYHGGNGTRPHTRGECVEILAKHLRLSITDARMLSEDIGLMHKVSPSVARKAFTMFVDGERRRWRMEADALRELFATVD